MYRRVSGSGQVMPDLLEDSCVNAIVKVILYGIVYSVAGVVCFAYWVLVYTLIGIVALFWGLVNLARRKPFKEGIRFPFLKEILPFYWDVTDFLNSRRKRPTPSDQ
ncbi:hypothetical protein ACFRIC_09950 [Streptomyces sp. NPDC056738]|uniref:hypothetical protein n=1 Tax=Streptomyces sp. NPDC056738 TaxID=3345933 RepID=UPI0036B8E960